MLEQMQGYLVVIIIMSKAVFLFSWEITISDSKHNFSVVFVMTIHCQVAHG